MKTIKVFDIGEIPMGMRKSISGVSHDDLFIYTVNGFVGEYDAAPPEDKKNYSLTDVTLSREVDAWFRIQGCTNGERILIDRS